MQYLFFVYINVPNCDTGEWVWTYTYGILADHPAIDSFDTDDPPALLLRGHIPASGPATFLPDYQVGVNHPVVDTNPEDDASTVYTFQAYDSAGNRLFVHSSEPNKVDIHDDRYARELAFNEPVQFMTNIQKLELRHGQTVLGTITNPGQGPSVQITAPAGGTNWPASALETVTWTSQSPANQPLTALVQYSPDGGATRIKVTLQGEAADRQEPLPAAAFHWSSDRDGVLGTGPLLTTSKLSAGRHVLTLTVTDSGGLTSSAHVTVDVSALPFPVWLPEIRKQ